MKTFLALALLSLSLTALAAPVVKVVAVEKKTWDLVRKDLKKKFKVETEIGDAALVSMTLSEIEDLSHAIHSRLKRCGGFMTYDSVAEAKGVSSNKAMALPSLFIDYSIDQQEHVHDMLDHLSEDAIRETISKLTEFETRHYLSAEGTRSSLFIQETWKKITESRSDVTVELFRHEQWPQPSVVLTIMGSEAPDEIVVIGGHADSIAMEGVRSPGADDNASGIATITEVLRLMVLTDFKPKKTIQIMAYAAEEVGLLGSRDIAKSYKKNFKKVAGVLQFDMTLFKGTVDKDILLMSDYTDKNQNAFIGKLIDEYVKVPWGYSRCGYGCSDHATWTAMGFNSSFPFEASMEEHNQHIHSAEDTLEVAGGDVDHVVKFVKLAAAFVVEMSN